MEPSPKIDLSGCVSDATKHEAAVFVANRLRRIADGDPADPETWENVARLYGITIRKFTRRDEPRGCGLPRMWDDAGLVGGVIAVNATLPPGEQAAVWIHELSHLLIAAWLPTQLASRADAVSYYYDDREGVCHEIARRVERLLLSAAV